MITITKRRNRVTGPIEYSSDYEKILKINKLPDGEYVILVELLCSEGGSMWNVIVNPSEGDSLNDGTTEWNDFDKLIQHMEIANYNSNIDSILAVL